MASQKYSTEKPVINKANNTYTYGGKTFGLNAKGTAYEEIKPQAPVVAPPQPSVSPAITQMILDPSRTQLFQNSVKDTGSIDLYNQLHDIEVGKAQELLKRYYGDIQSADKKSALSTGETDAIDYQNAVDALNMGLRQDTEALANKEGTQGTWGSSAREERSRDLANTYNTKYSSLFNQAKARAEKMNIAQEQQYGNEATYTTGIAQFSANGAQPQTQGSYRYNPFGGVGTFGATKKAAANTLANENLYRRLTDKMPNIQ